MPSNSIIPFETLGSTDAAVEILRTHAKAMAAEGRQSVNEILTGLHEKTKSPSGTANDDNKAAGNRAGAERTENNQASWSGSQIQCGTAGSRSH